MELSRRADLGREVLARHFGGRPESWAWRVVGAGPEERAVVEYSGPAGVVIGKFAHADEGETAFRVLDSLTRLGGTTLRVPVPHGHDPGLGLLIMSCAIGTPGPALDPEHDPEPFFRIGAALAELHALPVGGLPARRMSDHIAELIHPAPELLADARPANADLIHDTLRRLRALDRDAEAWPVVPLHRDFHLRQIVDDGLRIHVLDWDLCAAGDPAFDVGFFTTYLATHLTPSAAAIGSDAFLSGYGPTSELRGRLPHYARFNLLRRACRRFRLRDAGWEESLGAMLGRLALLA